MAGRYFGYGEHLYNNARYAAQPEGRSSRRRSVYYGNANESFEYEVPRNQSFYDLHGQNGNTGSGGNAGYGGKMLEIMLEALAIKEGWAAAIPATTTRAPHMLDSLVRVLVHFEVKEGHRAVPPDTPIRTLRMMEE
ncbi:hypothetical protein LTR62_001373 [Meristemomyces frigidus]|uniref:Uncharacterized protein n=1 Tax=Meristemomyces frigidus TaxID=1508187 RepID=A0AAN7YBG5_9PEZI|nr:hypothetical protein LTR62_001373 [Meristemomyces frigidus]